MIWQYDFENKKNDAQYNKNSVQKDVNEHKTQEGNTLNEIFLWFFSLYMKNYALDLGVLGHFISWQSRKRKTQLQKNFRCSIISIHSTFSSLLQCNKFMEYVFLVVLINFFINSNRSVSHTKSRHGLPCHVQATMNRYFSQCSSQLGKKEKYKEKWKWNVVTRVTEMSVDVSSWKIVTSECAMLREKRDRMIDKHRQCCQIVLLQKVR